MFTSGVLESAAAPAVDDDDDDDEGSWDNNDALAIEAATIGGTARMRCLPT